MGAFLTPRLAAGLHAPGVIARTGRLAIADPAAELAHRVNTALARRQRQLVGCSAPYDSSSVATATRLFHFAGKTTSTVAAVRALWILGPRVTHGLDPIATARLYTRKTGDAGYQSHPLVHQARSDSSGPFTPDQHLVVSQTLTSLDEGASEIAVVELEAYVEITYGMRVLGFALVEEPRTTLPVPSVAVNPAYASPGLPVRTDPRSAVAAGIGNLWSGHGPVIAWWLAPLASSTTSTTLVNAVDVATTTKAYTNPGVRYTPEKLTRLGQATVPLVVWVAGESGAGTLTWELFETTYAGSTTSIATGTITSGTVTTARANPAWTPPAESANYQMMIKSSSGAVTVKLWGWGMYLESY